jgi:hypothetical protein
MNKIIYGLVLSLVVVGGLVFANREIKNETPEKSIPKPLSAAEKEAALKAWEATPDGIKYKAWQASPEGKKVQASHDKIKKHIKDFSDMEAIVTSLTFQREGKSSEIKWLIVRIDDAEYMMQFTPKDFQQLSSLKVNDKIIVKSSSAGFSPNHPYLMIAGDYIARNNEVLFKRDLSKNKHC